MRLKTNLTHAGGVVTRVRDGETLVLLVRAKPEPHDWVLPKGHIEAGEKPEDTACREVREEAGVDAEIVSCLGPLEFAREFDDVRAAVFLMRYVRDVPAAEDRETRWSTFDEAGRLVRFDDMRGLIRQARERTEQS